MGIDYGEISCLEGAEVDVRGGNFAGRPGTGVSAVKVDPLRSSTKSLALHSDEACPETLRSEEDAESYTVTTLRELLSHRSQWGDCLCRLPCRFCFNMKMLAIRNFMSLVLNTSQSVARAIGVDFEFWRPKQIGFRKISINFAIITLLKGNRTVYLHYKTCFTLWTSEIFFFRDVFSKNHGVALMIDVFALNPTPTN